MKKLPLKMRAAFFSLSADRAFRSELFSKKELKTLETVATTFALASSSEMIERSHSEEAWKKTSEAKRISVNLSSINNSTKNISVLV